MAVVLMSSSVLSSAWWAVALSLMVITLVFAPQPVRKLDKRVVAFIVAAALGGALEMIFTKICDWCPYCIECWFQ